MHCPLFPFSLPLSKLLTICKQSQAYTGHCGRFFCLYSGHCFWVSLKPRLKKKCLVTVKSLARLQQIGQLGAVRQRWLQLPLKHLPHVSKTAPLPLSLAETFSEYFCVCVFFRTLNSQPIHTESTVSTTPCITINTTPSYSARRR